MPDAGIQPPYLDPSQYPAYLDLQRKQMLAQMLMGSAQQQAQTPADWNSMRVVPKRSALANISTLATALMAGKANKDLLGAQANYYQGLMGGGGSAPTPSSAPASTAPPSAPSAIAQQQATTPAVQQSNPDAMLLVPGDRRQSQALLTMMGPQKYGEALATRMAPTELQKTLTAAGVPQDQQQAILRANVVKQNYIAPVGGARPGTIAFDPLTGKPLFAQPDVAHNVQLTPGPNGVTAKPIEGNVEAQAGLAGAEAGAKAANTPAVIPTAGGGSTYGYPQDIAGTPPALRNGAAPNGGINSARQAPRVAQPTGAAPPAATGWAGMPRLPISSATGAPDAYTEGRLKAAGAKDAELSSQYGKEADLADQKLQYNVDARKLLETSELGPSSEWMTENRAKLLEWGVPESVIPGSGKVTDTMELNKYLKQSALQGARQIFGSRMTQMEVKLQHEELSPSTSMTKDAIASLMRTDDIKQQYAKQRAEDYGQYIANHGDPLRFESWYAKNFPLTKFAENAAKSQPAATATAAKASPVKQAPPAALQYLQQHPEMREAFKAKYGYLP